MSRLEENFAVKLRRRRMALGYTQKTLANSIGYSEKLSASGSRGGCFLPLTPLLRVADALQVSLDDLMDFQEDPSFFLGIDGGATKTDFALADGEGRIISRTLLGSSNPVDIGIEAAMEVLEAGIRHVCRGISLRRISMFAGISGGTSGDNRERLHAFFSGFHFAKFDNGSDAQPIVAAGLQDRDGMVVIMGTGSVVFVQRTVSCIVSGALAISSTKEETGTAWGVMSCAPSWLRKTEAGIPPPSPGCLLSKPESPPPLPACRNSMSWGSVALPPTRRWPSRPLLPAIRSHRISLFGTCGKSPVFSTPDGGNWTSPLKAEVVFVGGLTNHETLLMPLIQKELAEKERYRFSVYREPAVNGALLLAGLKRRTASRAKNRNAESKNNAYRPDEQRTDRARHTG